MSQRRENFYHIGGTAETSGLDLSAMQDTVDETQFWEMEGLISNRNGNKRISRRPTAVNWATRIAEPTSLDLDVSEEISKLFFCTKDEWGDPVTTGDNILGRYRRGAINISGWENAPASTSTVEFERTIAGDEGFGTNDDQTLAFNIRALALTSVTALKLQYATKENELREVLVSSTGMAIKTGVGSWSSVSGTAEIVDGKPHLVVLRLEDDNLEISIDGTEIDAGAWTYVENTSDYFVKLTGYSYSTTSSDPYTILLSSFILRDTADDPLKYPRISDIHSTTEVKAASSLNTVSLLVASEGYLWEDYNLTEVWRPIVKLSKDRCNFSKYRGSTIICNYNDNSKSTSVYQYKGGELTLLDLAPDIRYTTEFVDRLWGGGDVNHPNRVFFTGSREPNLWYNPDDPDIPSTVDAQLNAGFMEFPGDEKERVRNIYGDAFGILLVGTDRNTFMVSGTSPEDFFRKRLPGAVGCAGERCGVDVFNDYWVLDRNGVASIKATDKYGDLEAGKISSLAGELFDTDISSARMLNPTRLGASQMVYYAKTNTLLLHSFEAGKEEGGVIYAMHAGTGKWSGPWREELTALSIATLGFPLMDMVVLGTADGYVKYLSDHQSNTDNVRLTSPVITGRSMDPKFPDMKKTWRHFRLRIVPTGDWDVVFRWKVEDQPWKTLTRTLCKADHVLVGSTAVTEAALAKSTKQPQVIEFPLEARGLSIKYEILTNAPWVDILSWGMDFTVPGHERD